MSEKQKRSRRTEIKKIEDPSKRLVTFSKRRSGLFSKAAELSVLSGAQIAVLVLSGTGRPYSVGNPDVDTVIDRYLGGITSPADDVDELIKAEEENGGDTEWWDVPMEGMGLEELQRYKEYLEDLSANVDDIVRQRLAPQFF